MVEGSRDREARKAEAGRAGVGEGDETAEPAAEQGRQERSVVAAGPRNLFHSAEAEAEAYGGLTTLSGGQLFPRGAGHPIFYTNAEEVNRCSKSGWMTQTCGLIYRRKQAQSKLFFDEALVGGGIEWDDVWACCC